MLSERPEVVAVVPTLGGDLERLKASLQAALASDFEGRLTVVVVWNDPRRPVPELPGVEVLQPGLNLGFAGALHHARSRADAEFLWALQDDVRPEPDCLRRILGRLSAADQPAVVSPVMLNAAGLVPARSRGGVLGPDGAMDHWFPEADTRPEDLDLDHRLDFVASSGMLTRLAVWDDVGGFDPDFYPVSWSDVDFCHRVRSAGHRLALVPAAHIAHDRNASTPGLFGQFLATANQQRFRSKHLDGSAPAALDLDADLAQRVARSASLVLVDFVGHATTAHRTAIGWAEQIESTLRAELAVRNGRIADLECELVTEVRDRDRRISALRRKLGAQDRRITELKGELVTIRSSRSWRVARALGAVRARLGRRPRGRRH
ncbi:MAG: glycosyltransferase [Propionibacteriales bacterium]|nr:glycosyltransferase [Propionibacteriales bacterium]